MTDFKRPIPSRQNDLLRKNLSAPQYDQESLSEKSLLWENRGSEIEIKEKNRIDILIFCFIIFYLFCRR